MPSNKVDNLGYPYRDSIVYYLSRFSDIDLVFLVQYSKGLQKSQSLPKNAKVPRTQPRKMLTV
jgi:hypothetical protein